MIGHGSGSQSERLPRIHYNMVSDNSQYRIEAGDELRQLIARLRENQEAVITVDGVEAARLVPLRPEAEDQRPIEDVIREIEEFGSRHTLGGLSWKELRDEGRKW